LVEEEGSTYVADNDADSDVARTLRPLQAATCTYRIAKGCGLQAGKTLFGGAINARQIAADSKGRFKRVGCRVRDVVGTEKSV